MGSVIITLVVSFSPCLSVHLSDPGGVATPYILYISILLFIFTFSLKSLVLYQYTHDAVRLMLSRRVATRGAQQ